MATKIKDLIWDASAETVSLMEELNHAKNLKKDAEKMITLAQGQLLKMTGNHDGIENHDFEFTVSNVSGHTSYDIDALCKAFKISESDLAPFKTKSPDFKRSNLKKK